MSQTCTGGGCHAAGAISGNSDSVTEERNETELLQQPRYLVVVIYDIENNRRRYYMSKLLSAYGRRVQRSAFECELSPQKIEKLKAELNRFAREEDLIRLYRIRGQTDIRVWGKVGLTAFDEVIII